LDQISVAEDSLGEAELRAGFPAYVFNVCREPRQRHHPRLEGQVTGGVGQILRRGDRVPKRRLVRVGAELFERRRDPAEDEKVGPGYVNAGRQPVIASPDSRPIYVRRDEQAAWPFVPGGHSGEDILPVHLSTLPRGCDGIALRPGRRLGGERLELLLVLRARSIRRSTVKAVAAKS